MVEYSQRTSEKIIKGDLGRCAATFRTDQFAVELSIQTEFCPLETEWRAFEKHADCTVFQSFDWLQTWHRNVGKRNGIIPIIVIGRQNGRTLFLLPFGLAANGFFRRLTWLGSCICNYNAPLLNPSFAQEISDAGFAVLWQQIVDVLSASVAPDIIDLQKMPETVGRQRNPFLNLSVIPHADDAYQATLTGTWDDFYKSKRPSVARKNDRRSRKRLEEYGPVSFVSPKDHLDIARTIDVLIEQKNRAFALWGVDNIFKRPGYREFLLDFASSGQRCDLAHVSYVTIGSSVAASNFGLTFRGRYYYILASYDVSDGEKARFGPGLFQLRELLRYSIEHNFKEFDFTIGDEPYKREWHDKVTKLFDGTYSISRWGLLLVFPLRSIRRLKRWIKHNEPLWTLIRKRRAQLGWRHR